MPVVLRRRGHINKLQLKRPGHALGRQRVVGQAGTAQTQRKLVGNHDQTVLDGRLLLGARARHRLAHALQASKRVLLGATVCQDEKRQLLGRVGGKVARLVAHALGRAKIVDRLVRRLVSRRGAVDRKHHFALLTPIGGQQSPGTGVQDAAALDRGNDNARRKGQQLGQRQRGKRTVDPPRAGQQQNQRNVGKYGLPHRAQPRDGRAVERVLDAGKELTQHGKEQAQRVQAQKHHAKVVGMAVVQAKEHAKEIGHSEKSNRPEACEHGLDVRGDLGGVLDRLAVVLAKEHRDHRLHCIIAGQNRRGKQIVDRHHHAHGGQGLGAAVGQKHAVSHNGLQRHAAAREALRRAAAKNLDELLANTGGAHQRKRVAGAPKVQKAYGKAGPAGQANREAHAKDPQLKDVKRGQRGEKIGHARRHCRAHGQVFRPVERDRLQQDARREVRDVAHRRAVHVVDGALRQLAAAAHKGHDRLGSKGVDQRKRRAKEGEKPHA